MAVTKIIPIRSTIEKSVAYITNGNKTGDCLYVSSEHCVPETAAVEFQFLLDRAEAGGRVIGRHLIQSFAPGEATPEQAHELGKKLAEEILCGQYAYVLATHLDRDHIHNHFVWCAVNIETHRRYVSNKASYHKIQDASDRLCAEFGLSVITEKSGHRGKSYTEYQADKYGTSWKTLLRRTLDAAIRSANTFEGFLIFMREAGYEIKHVKYISFRAAGQERFTRAKTVGDNYTEERIRERLSEPKRHLSPRLPKPSIKKVLDRSNPNIQSSPGYRQWASLHNLKASAETMIYLQKNFGSNLAAFERRYEELIERRGTLQAEHDKVTGQVAGDKSLGVMGRINKLNSLNAQRKQKTAALNAEIAEMERVRQNILTNHGERFYEQTARPRRKEISL